MKWTGLFEKPSASVVSENQMALLALRKENQKLQQECCVLKMKLEMMTLKYDLAQVAVRETLATMSAFSKKP